MNPKDDGIFPNQKQWNVVVKFPDGHVDHCTSIGDSDHDSIDRVTQMYNLEDVDVSECIFTVSRFQ